MKFIPDEQTFDDPVPLLSEARADDGWKGQSTDKSVPKLRSEIAAEIGRLGGTMSRWIRGDYEMDDGTERPGIEIGYSIATEDGRIFQGRINVAALPFKISKNRSDSDKLNRDRAEKSLRMALFNVRDALQASRILQVLSPGYAGLMPWLLVEGQKDKTISELWGDTMGLKALPAPADDGEVVDVKFRMMDE